MSDLNEPAHGGYVATRVGEPHPVLVYRRDDECAQAAGDPEAHWFCTDKRYSRAMTWTALSMSPIAYVGQFVDRNDYTEHRRATPWQGAA
ncbi:hypothetical protein GCM10010172_07480 [Paractinoplanes ferrugineus]|uniref:Uncharacterized protein n=1 Tax=Paractinoplanes ferrugineus TaxID=113564 RepID=A0A919JGM8_9ACTN|nr:hypothetical protein [Actinoplanes ferrugineus]GIE16851.1 hypothetical protein Afe05nite_86910 [Actinoplanes ferrugineus]